MRAAVIGIIGIIISFVVGLTVVGTLINSVNRAGWSAQANNTWTSLVNNIWTAFAILVILPLIFGAVVLLSMLGGFGGKGGL